MRPIINILGVLLIVIGIAALAYQGFTYTSQEKIAEVGPVKVTADTEKTVYLPPIFGVLSLVAGVVLIVVGRKN